MGRAVGRAATVAIALLRDGRRAFVLPGGDIGIHLKVEPTIVMQSVSEGCGNKGAWAISLQRI